MAMRVSDLHVHHKIIKLLKSFAAMRTQEYRLYQRAMIVLLAIDAKTDKEISQLVHLHYNNVAIWRKRFFQALERLCRIAQKTPEILEKELRKVLSDVSRKGRPPVFDSVCRAFIIGIACNKPEDYGFERSHWSLPVLRKAILDKGITTSISASTISRILMSDDLKPHKNRYWLHSKEKDEDPEQYARKVHEINRIYLLAAMIRQFGGESDVRIISTDEMTGIQALERKYPDKSAKPHMTAKTEFEYIRHGTTSLIGFFDVVNGTMQTPFLNKTRTSDDFAVALEHLLNSDPGKHWIIVADNLNTHYSEPVVKLVGKHCGIDDETISEAIKSRQSRISFLTDYTHRIRFSFTPKHCSWMNQIEIWFGILNRQLLKRKSYTSVTELTDSIRRFIDEYNSLFAKPFNWKYDTTPIGDYSLFMKISA